MTYFSKGKSHIGIVTETIEVDGRDPYNKVVGIVTLEDIIDEIINVDDEDDFH